MFYTVYTWTIYPFHMKNVLFTMEKWKKVVAVAVVALLLLVVVVAVAVTHMQR